MSPGSVLLARTDDAGGQAPCPPPSLRWLGLLRYMLPTASLSSAEDPASVSPQQQSAEQHAAFYYFLPFLFVLLIVSKAVIAKYHKLGV